jgi:hypothetical protein
MTSSDEKPERNTWHEVMRVYGFATVMFAVAIIPVLNFTYSGHGGISWFLVPLCFPYVVVRAAIGMTTSSEASRHWYKRFFAITIPVYILLAVPLSWAATTSLRNTFGLQISTWRFFALMASPFPWWYFT